MLEFNVSGQMLLLEGPSPGPHGGRKGQPFQAIARIAQLLPAGAHPLSLFSLLPLAERDGEVLTHGKAFNKCRLRTAEEFIRGALEERLLSLLTSNLLPTSGDPSRGWPEAIFLPRPPVLYRAPLVFRLPGKAAILEKGCEGAAQSPAPWKAFRERLLRLGPSPCLRSLEPGFAELATMINGAHSFLSSLPMLASRCQLELRPAEQPGAMALPAPGSRGDGPSTHHFPSVPELLLT